ncbi:MAG: lysylphosphatidylglycerol synthase transmembrane domain-containing protein, partial [Anaerolineaceae bacterium]
MAEPKSNKWKKVFRLTGTILSVILLVYLFYSIGWDEISAGLKAISPWRIAAVIFIMAVSRLATFARWHVLLQIDKIKVNWKDSLRLTMAGLFMGNFLPTTIGGDMVRLAGAVRLGIDASLAAASLMVDRLIGMTGMAMVLPLGLVHVSTLLSPGNPDAAASFKFFSVGVWSQKLFHSARQLIVRAVDSFVYWYKHPLT